MSLFRFEGKLMPNRIIGVLLILFSTISIASVAVIAYNAYSHDRDQLGTVVLLMVIMMGFTMPLGLWVFFDDRQGMEIIEDLEKLRLRIKWG